jgi:hypothetical protein
MLEYLDYPSVVKVAVRKDDIALAVVVYHDVRSCYSKLRNLLVRQAGQQKQVFSTAGPLDLIHHLRLWTAPGVIAEWARLARCEKRMGPVKWEQHCQAREKEIHDFTEQYGTHPPVSWMENFREELLDHYEDLEGHSHAANNRLCRYIQLLQESLLLKQAPLYNALLEEMDDTVEGLDSMRWCKRELIPLLPPDTLNKLVMLDALASLEALETPN